MLKPGPLTEAERIEMERHAERGQRILERGTSPIVHLAAEIAGTHRERWDCTEYPHGLGGEAIALSGWSVAVADVFDALTTERPCKEAWAPETARAFLAEKAGTHFDVKVIEAFLSRWPDVVAQGAVVSTGET
ncbi:response regulator RpfG family c-di-GMP phosphodiesterase [Methylobacterium sp. BE186]|nr:response regulator RpfG family c-di-GMP phosphodiesterase [Methylobacterium sp. BE186]